ncbi:MAG: N-acetyltransferase [Myxococcota bacterium]
MIHGVVQVGPARRRDALATLALHREVLAEGSWFVTRPAEDRVTLDQREREIEALSAADNSWFLVARGPDASVVGYLTANGGALDRTRHLSRLELVVGAPWRGQGIGRALLDTVIGLAERSGVVRKLSLAVLADNERALRLYRSAGFVEEGRRVGEYRESDGTLRDDLVLARVVHPRGEVTAP